MKKTAKRSRVVVEIFVIPIVAPSIELREFTKIKSPSEIDNKEIVL
jgi:hypothetical protein